MARCEPLSRRAWCGAVLAASVLAGCATAPAPAPRPAPLTSSAPDQMLAIVHAEGAPGDTELAVRPLRDPATADLRDRAAAWQAQGALDLAAAALDEALSITPDDPALLQERAEVALLSAEFAKAAALAERAFALGSQVGPLCRRHWATAWQAWLGSGDRAAADAAHARIEACRLDRPARY